jgi:hypothetical protein
VPSEKYRYYRLDKNGQLHGATSFEAEDDDVAIEQVKTKHPDAKAEVWQDRRSVANVGSHGVQAAIQSSAKAIERSLDLLRKTGPVVRDR